MTEIENIPEQVPPKIFSQDEPEYQISLQEKHVKEKTNGNCPGGEIVMPYENGSDTLSLVSHIPVNSTSVALSTSVLATPSGIPLSPSPLPPHSNRVHVSQHYILAILFFKFLLKIFWNPKIIF